MNKITSPSIYIWRDGVLLGLLFSLMLTVSASSSSSALIPCGLDEPQCRLSGGFSAVSVENPTLPGVTAPSSHAFGALIYDDFKILEAKAQGLLTESKEFRKSISPHNEKPGFDEIVIGFDYKGAGFDSEILGSNPPMTIRQRIDKADQALREARDLYAFLAVFADSRRFRVDSDLGCSLEPQLDDPIADPPVVDRCNFPARMRESIREGAYMRMIFGQQFTADALGLYFGAEIAGGEAFVIDEVRKLERAVAQYDKAQEIVEEGLRQAVGNGCLISDFYTQAEWALLSRAVDGRERAMHHIATRKSYLDLYGPNQAGGDYRTTSSLQHVNIIGANGLASRPEEERCPAAREYGQDPDNLMLTEMAVRMLETRRAFQTLQDGRNIFGFDIEFTPARPYRTDIGSNDRGLLNAAKEAANRALELQRDSDSANREFDRKQEKLTESLQKIFDGRDEKIQAQVGCDRTPPVGGSLSDEEYFACVDAAIAQARFCVPAGNTEAELSKFDDEEKFEACTNTSVLPVSDLRQSVLEMRAIYLQIKRIKKEKENIQKRVNSEELRNTKIRSALINNGIAQSAVAATEGLLESGTVEFDGTGATIGFNPHAPIIAAARAAGTIAQSMADVSVEGSSSKDIVKNLWLDASQLVIDIDIAAQEYRAKYNEFEGIIGQTQHDVLEAQRERAYLQSSPANDPSYRLVRDSARLGLATQLEYAAKVSYLAARRAEYETAGRLSANNVRISDIYRARTADDILAFLTKLEDTTDNLIVEDAQVNQEDFTLSVAQHILGYTNEFLELTGEAAEQERTERFRTWLDGKTEGSVVRFTFNTSLVDNGIFSNIIQPEEAYRRFWLFKIAGHGQPKAGNNGMGMNLVTDQEGLGYRRVTMTQAGTTHLRSRAGCIFQYKLKEPAALLGLDWPADQLAEEATTDFKSAVNGQNGETSAAFLGRPVSASEWTVEIFLDAPEAGLPTMHIQQLSDIKLLFSTTRASRSDTGAPRPEECVRGDF